MLLLIAPVRRLGNPLPRWAHPVAAYGIGTIAMGWFIQRTLSFWGF
jgi:hypothetical protein